MVIKHFKLSHLVSITILSVFCYFLIELQDEVGACSSDPIDFVKYIKQRRNLEKC